MQVIENVYSMKKYINAQKQKGKTIGFVPTMGCLHEGHVSMIGRSHKENDITIISCFVNIAHFPDAENYKKYPRDFEHDYKVGENAGADVMFFPENSAILGANSKVFLDLVGGLSGNKTRGLATAAIKFLNILRPDKIYYSILDIKELSITEQIIQDLHLDAQVVPCEIAREPSGLAIDVENEKLTPTARDEAVLVHMALEYAAIEVSQGEQNAMHLKRIITNYMQDAPLAKIKNISILSLETFKEAVQLKGQNIIIATVSFGDATLRDNIIVTVK